MRPALILLATIVCACAHPPRATDLAGCYQFHWTDEGAGTWDAPLPDRIHLSDQQARSTREQGSYEAALRYAWLMSSDTVDGPTLFSVHPTWQLLGADSLEIDLSGGRSPQPFRYVLRARHDDSGLVGAMGARSSRGFVPLVAFAARSSECAADTAHAPHHRARSTALLP